MRQCLVLVCLILGSLPAQAGDCVVKGPPAHLDAQPIEWTFEIASGQRCLRGLRLGSMTLDSVTISSPAKFGAATTQGYSFAYSAPRDFKGEDSFSVSMAGSYRGVRGTSVIRVNVSVR